MKYAHTVLHVPDVKKTAKFYEKAFGFSCEYISYAKDYAELNTGETKIVFAKSLIGSNDKNPNTNLDLAAKESVVRVEISFVSDNIIDDYNRAVKFGAKVFDKLKKQPWGQMTAYLIDNNGFLIALSSSD